MGNSNTKRVSRALCRKSKRKKGTGGWAWWCKPTVAVLRKLKQGSWEFNIGLGYIVSSIAWETQ